MDHMECTKSLYKLLEKLYFKGIKILDVPCGPGHYFRKISELGEIEYFGIDLDPRAIEMAKEIWKDAPNAKFDVQDISKLNLEDNSINVVYCYNLLFTLKNYKEALKELFRVSKKYILVRSLFDEKENTQSFNIDEDYLEAYFQVYNTFLNSGTVQYKTYARGEIIKFLKSLGNCKIKFIKDNVAIPKENIEKQAKMLGVDVSEFTTGAGDKKQDWKGLSLNWEVLFIEK